MKIQTHTHAAFEAPVKELAEGKSAYRDAVERMCAAKPYRSRDEINANDAALQAFREALGAKGALLFFAEFNLEKIEEMMEKYRQELERFSEENPDIPMDISKMLSDYRKQLMEQLMNAQDEKKAQMLNPNRAVSELMLQLSEQKFVQEKTPFESLLHAKSDAEDATVLI